MQAARNRGTSIALLLDRVPPRAGDAVREHFRDMLVAHDLGGAPLFVLPETPLDGQGLLAERSIAPMRDWFTELAESAAARAAVVRQTVGGAIRALESAVDDLVEAADDQVTATEALAAGVHAAYRAAESTVEQGVRDGALLRGKVEAGKQLSKAPEAKAAAATATSKSSDSMSMSSGTAAD